MLKTTLIVPALNELEGLKTIMPLIKPEWCDQTIILVGKPILDDTVAWSESQGYDVFVGEWGLWNGYRNLFASGLVRGDVIVTFSPDGNSLPEVIPQLVQKIKDGYNMVIASRYLGNATSDDDTRLTALGNRVLTWLVNRRGSFHYTDALVMFRAYKVDIASQLDFDRPLTPLQKCLTKLTGLYSWEPSLSIRTSRASLRIAEIPASEPPALRERRQNTFIHGLAILTQITSEVLR